MKSELIHFVSEDNNIPKVLDLFKSNFLKTFKKITNSNRKPIYMALPHIYRLWYYCALMEDSIVSPASYINAQVNMRYGDTAMIVPISTPITSKTSIKDFEFNYRVFSCEDHPILRDILNLIEICAPAVELDKEDNIKTETFYSIIDNLTFREANYSTFLTRVCLRLQLLKKLPSINTNQAQVIPTAVANFFKLSKVHQLKRIVEAVFLEASDRLMKAFPYDKKLFTYENLSTLFKDSCNMSEFFQSYFTNLGTDINELIEDLSLIINSDDLDESTIASLSVYFTLNSLMDSMLITPLGYYLQLIQPIYAEMYDFKFKIGEIVKAYKSKQISIESYFFESCTTFDITPLGKVILSATENLTYYQEFPKDTDYNKVFSSIMDWNRNFEIYRMFSMLKTFDEIKHNLK